MLALKENVQQASEHLDGLNTTPPEFETWLSTQFVKNEIDAALEDELVAHFPFDVLEEDRTPDLAMQGHTGLVNTRLLNVLDAPSIGPGKHGKAFTFDGENYVSIGDQADFEYTDRFSYGGWIKHQGEREKDATFIVKRNEEQRRGGYQLVLTTDNRIRADLIHDQNKVKIEVQTQATLPSDTWSHVFATYDGSGLAEGVTIYLDGAIQETEVVTDYLRQKSILNGNDVLIGNWTTRNTPHGELYGFEGGSVDEVRMYSRELAPVEVSVLAGKDPIQSYELAPDAQKAQVRENEILPFYLNRYDQAFMQARNRLDSLRGIHLEVPNIMIMEEMEEPRITHVLARGAYDAPQEAVEPGTPAVLGGMEESLPQNRLGLAQWLFLPEHPLTSRVAVNRAWQGLFGQGIVETPEDFGNQGALPTHPELLDWLAVEFRESGWDTKALIKELVLSSTYRQAAEIDPDLYRVDPDNQLLARGPAQRFSAEMFRDNALHVSGLLNPEVGGPWVKPYQPPGVWKELANQIGENKYRPSTGLDVYRRSIYSYWKRTIPPPFMLTFDAAERTVCVVERQTTSTPLQSLVMLNDPQLVEASRKLAERMLGQESVEVKERISYGFFLTTTRLPDRTELRTLEAMYKEEYERYANAPGDAKALLSVGSSVSSDRFDPAELAAYTVIANTMINLDEAKRRS